MSKFNFASVDDNLIGWIQCLSGILPATQLDQKLYYIKEGDRYSYPFEYSQDSLKKVAGHLKSKLVYSKLSDEFLLVVASWFIKYLNQNHEVPTDVPAVTKSILLRTYSDLVVKDTKAIYWALRDLYFPNQSCGDTGFLRYENNEELFSSSGWRKFHLANLTHLDDDQYERMIRSIARQNNSLFHEKYPLILIADPSQKKVDVNLFVVDLD